ncbi:MAG: hypothetical protein K9G05_04200 [Candidatus Nanopelagicales bacterium]|nr:hypothetical protein [Candidatus Nanopelagicales bacterium]MCF8539787.1 hypothetical protein [Candidatus Nanopelagicales bacterium]MCF8551266.1 hypothetical protein [Candidatus Nanopelagicales bacterium]
MTKSPNPKKQQALTDIEEAAKEWRAAKKKERANRETLATLVREHVDSDLLSENKISTVTGIPRMTIRKMLGKS